MNPTKSELLVDLIEHIDIKKHNVVPLVEAMSKMAFSARDLARAADVYDAMLREEDCAIILCLAGSLISAASPLTEFTIPTLTKISCGFATPLAARLQTRSSRGRILRANLFARWAGF